MDTIFSSLKEQLLNSKCSRHSEMNCDILIMNPKYKENGACFLFIQEQQIPYNQFVSIRQLLNCDYSSNEPLYPLLKDEDLQKWIESDSGLEKTLNEIKQYFSKLQSSVMDQIGIMMENEIKRIQNLIIEYKDSQSSLQKLYSIKPIQDVLISKDDNVFHEYITKQLDEIEKDILCLVRKMNFFSDNNSQNISVIDSNQSESLIIPAEEVSYKNWDESRSTIVKSKQRSSANQETISSHEQFKHSLLQVETWIRRLTVKHSQQDYSSQFYFVDSLDNNKNYFVKFELTRQNGNICFGLISKEDKVPDYSNISSLKDSIKQMLLNHISQQ